MLAVVIIWVVANLLLGIAQIFRIYYRINLQKQRARWDTVTCSPSARSFAVVSVAHIIIISVLWQKVPSVSKSAFQVLLGFFWLNSLSGQVRLQAPQGEKY
jgi:hypothetical protein